MFLWSFLLFLIEVELALRFSYNQATSVPTQRLVRLFYYNHSLASNLKMFEEYQVWWPGSVHRLVSCWSWRSTYKVIWQIVCWRFTAVISQKPYSCKSVLQMWWAIIWFEKAVLSSHLSQVWVAFVCYLANHCLFHRSVATNRSVSPWDGISYNFLWPILPRMTLSLYIIGSNNAETLLETMQVSLIPKHVYLCDWPTVQVQCW